MSITWNPADKGANVTLSNGNMSAEANASNADSVRATASKASGKWYWEILIDVNATDHVVGIGTSSASITEIPGYDANGYGYNASMGEKGHSNTWDLYGDSYTTNDIIGIALDLDNGKIWFAKNNVWQASGDPAAGTNAAYTGLSGTFFPMHSPADFPDPDPADKATARFTVADQTYAAPSGFAAFESASTLTNLLDGKIRIKSAATDLLDGKLAVNTPANLLDGKIRIGDSASNLLDGKLAVNTPANLLDGKVSVVISPYDLLDGKAKIVLSPTNLLDGKARVAWSASDLLDGKLLVAYAAQIDATCPTPTCSATATFRYARIEAEAPTPTAGFRVGKRIEGECPAPGFTCTAYVGRSPSIIAGSPVPTCSMRVGLSLSDEATLFRKAGVPAPTCSMIADMHHLATLYGNVPAPTCEIIADTENVTIISASAPCPRGLFSTTIGNVADIYGRLPVPECSMEAITGIVVSLEGRVPVPGPLVRFHASLMNVSITLGGDVPVPTMASSVLCSLPSLVLRHERGEVR